MDRRDPSSSHGEATGCGLLAELLGAPDRDHCPGQLPVVSWREDDETEFLAALESRARERVRLVRRGIEHGHLAELDEGDAPDPLGMPVDAVLAQRWHTARPIVLRDLVEPRRHYGGEIAERRRLHDELKEPNGLRRFLKRQREELAPEYQIQPRLARLSDPERDLERVQLSWCPDLDDPRAPRVRDLWLKSGWLSTHDEDESVRLRLSFGRETYDDASRDVRRLRRVTELAARLLPECSLVHEDARLAGLLEGWVGSATFLTQHIAYWNAPGGGALFHHDAFAEDAVGGQKGVCFVQLTGASAWLALSIEDLARRVIEFAEYLEQGELPWVRARLFRPPAAYERFLALAGRFPRVRRELAKPDCGVLGKVVNRGPEFTSLLADAGHALILRAGDVLLLPNHGYSCTAMHSVFCAGDEPAYGLSMAIRERFPPALEG